ATGQVVERSTPLREDKLTAKYGWSRPSDPVRVLTRSEMRDANRLVRVAKLLHRTRSMTSGEFLPARYPELRETMTTGVIGVAGLLAAMEPLEQSAKRILDDARLAADQQLADLARGRASTDGATAPQRPLPVPEALRTPSRVLVAYLDPDGAEPADEVATRTRGFSLGRERQGTVPVRGNLLPEVAAQLQLLFDSILNPRV